MPDAKTIIHTICNCGEPLTFKSQESIGIEKGICQKCESTTYVMYENGGARRVIFTSASIEKLMTITANIPAFNFIFSNEKNNGD